jgi:hypothetical protein
VVRAMWSVLSGGSSGKTNTVACYAAQPHRLGVSKPPSMLL